MTAIQRILAWFLAIFGLIPAVPAQTQNDAPADALALTVMSYNVYVVDDLLHSHEKRAPGVVSLLRGEMPDIFCLQEANADWMERISAAMPEYAFVGVGRDDGETAGEFSPVFYDTRRFELTAGGTFWFSDTPDAPSRTWGSAYKRICSWAVLTERSSGAAFAVMNSHWDHLSETSRERSAETLLAKARALAPDLPVVLTGDFNCKANTAAYRTLVEGGFAGAAYTAPDADTIGSFHGYYKRSTAGELSIDHILFDVQHGHADAYRVLNEKVNGEYPSDHFPVLARLRLRTGADS